MYWEREIAKAEAKLDALIIAKQSIERVLQCGVEMPNAHWIEDELSLQAEAYNFKIQLARKNIVRLKTMQFPKMVVLKGN